jgi:hypothetical protein
MTRKISLIVGIAVTSLAFGVPIAFGERPLVGQPDGVAYFYANERATLGFGPVIHDHGDATQAKLLLPSTAMEIVRDHGDATQVKLQLHSGDAIEYFYANERATLGFGPVIHDHGDATQANLQLQSPAMEIVRDHGDATQAKLVAQGSTSAGSSDQVRLDPNRLSTPTVSASSGSEIEWPQLGIGFGLGILLVAGLWLAMRMTKGRPLVH